MQWRRVILVGTLIFAALWLPLVVVNLLYWGKLAVNPVEIQNRYYQAVVQGLISVLPVATGFWLLNVFWARRTEGDRLLTARHTVIRFYGRIYGLTTETLHLLAERYGTEEGQAADTRDTMVIEKLPLLRNSKDEFLALYPQTPIDKDIALENAVVQFWEKASPAIDWLCAHAKIHGDVDSEDRFRAQLESLACLAREILQAFEPRLKVDTAMTAAPVQAEVTAQPEHQPSTTQNSDPFSSP